MEVRLADTVLRSLEAQREHAVDMLRALSVVESPSSDLRALENVLLILRDRLRATGFATRLIRSPGSERPHLYARPTERKRGSGIQLLLGHCDTVWPSGTVATMPVDVAGEKMTGPGVFDMKGGLVQLILALETLKELDLRPALTPVVFVNSDEEIGSRDSTRYVRRLARIADRALVLEPALTPDGLLKTRRRGAARYTVKIRGVGAHAGIDPGTGASAILELSHVIQALHRLNDVDRGVAVNVGMIEGGIRPNVVASESSAVVDVRALTAEDLRRVDDAIRAIRATTPGTSVDISGGRGRPPMEPTERNRALWAQARKVGNALRLDLGEGLSGGSSDANTTSQFTATLDGLGAVGDGAHAAHEFVFIDKLTERAALLALLLLEPPAPAASTP